MPLREYMMHATDLVRMQALGSVAQSHNTAAQSRNTLAEASKMLVEEMAKCRLQASAAPQLRMIVDLPLDGWHARSSSAVEYRTKWDGWLQTLKGIPNAESDLPSLYLRFLSYSVMECEVFFDALLASLSNKDDGSLAYLLRYATKKEWLTEATGRTGKALKKFVTDDYFPFFKVGSRVDYRLHVA